MMYYKLNDDKTISPCSLEEWSKQFEELALLDKKHVGNDVINGHYVSTVWLGMCHNYWGDGPLVFETMVFSSKESGIDEYCERYSTWSEAEEGHKKAIQWVKDGCKDDE